MPLRKKKDNHFHGLLLSWLISYGIILALAFLFILSSYFFLSKNLKDESFRLHEVTVQQSQISMDYLHNEIYMITNQIASLSETKTLGGYQGKMGGRQHYLKYELMNELNQIHWTHPAVESVFVYFRDGDYVVNSNYSDNAQYFFTDKYPDSGMTWEGWKTLLFQDNILESFSLLQKGISAESEPCVQFVTTFLPQGKDNLKNIAVCITVKESTIADLIDGGNSTGRFFIMDGPGKTFLTGGANRLPDNFPSYRELESRQGGAFIWENQILTVFPSQESSWLYISLFPLSVVESRLNQTRWIIVGLVIIFWLIGIYTAYSLAKRNYKPVTRLMEYVSGEASDGEVTHFRREEYRYIEESFNRLREEKATIQDQLTLQREALRLNFLSRLLMGKLRETSHTLEEQCQYQDFYFEEDSFLTVILKMEGTVLSDDHLSQERGALWLSNQIQSLLSDFYYGIGWVCDINNLTVLFLNLQPPSDDPKLILLNFLSDLKGKILKETGITYTIGASSFKSDVSAIPLSYEEAQEALDLRMIKGKGAVISYYDIIERRQGERVFNSLNWERRFINLFTSGSYKEAGKVIQAALDKLENVRNVAVLRIRLFGFMNIFIDALSDFFDESFLEKLDCENRLLACTTLNETRREMEVLFGEINDYSLNQQDTSLKERVTEIMEEYYKDPNLSVGFLADQLELSISNFSWLYKEETGMGPLDCIHRIRLREAKILLHKSDMTVKEIAKECGYLSDIAFIRVFKKYEGVTPGQFRNEKKNQPTTA